MAVKLAEGHKRGVWEGVQREEVKDYFFKICRGQGSQPGAKKGWW